MTRARKSLTHGRQDAAAAALDAYLEGNDPGPLAKLLRGREALPKGVREFLAKLLLGEVRRRRGHPKGAGRGRIAADDARPFSYPAIMRRLEDLQNKGGLTLTRAKEELAVEFRKRNGSGSVRSIERALQAARAQHGLKPRARVFRRTNLAN